MEIKRLEEDIKDKEEKIFSFKRSEEELKVKLNQCRSLTEKQRREIIAFEKKLAEKEEKINRLESELNQLVKVSEEWRKMFKNEPKFKIYTIISETGSRNINELSKTLGIPSIHVKRILNELEEIGIIKIDGDVIKKIT